MGYEMDSAAPAAAPGGAAPAGRPAPGKRTLTERLAPRVARAAAPAPPAAEPEIEMTGVPLIDDGLFCDDHQGAPGCPLSAAEATYLLFALQTRALEYATVVMTQIGRVRLELVTRRTSHWSVWHEAVFMMITTALIGPLAGAVAGAAAKAAVSVALRGAAQAATALAKVDPKRVADALTMVSKMVRTSLAHRQDAPPTTQQEFLDYLEGLAAPTASAILDAAAAQQLDQRELLELLARLSDPAIIGPAAVRERIRLLVGQFDLNRVGQIGDRRQGIGDEAELAEPVRVRLRGRTYLVLCESFGARHLALELNGANLDGERPRMTMASRTFVRIVEPTFHALVESEFQAKRKRALEQVDFDDPQVRRATRWFHAFYAASKAVQEDPDAP